MSLFMRGQGSCTDLHGGKVPVWMRWHPDRVDRWRRSWAIGSASRSRIVLAATPAKSNTRIADGVALHLVDGHLSSMALNELDEATALARRDLHISDFAEALKEGSQLILGDVAREATNENSGVVGIGELVHGLLLVGIAIHWRLLAHLRISHLIAWLHHASHHAHATTTTAAAATHVIRATFILRGCSRDAHGSVATVDTLHLVQSTLLVIFAREANKAITARLASEWISHDFGRLAGRESALEE